MPESAGSKARCTRAALTPPLCPELVKGHPSQETQLWLIHTTVYDLSHGTCPQGRTNAKDSPQEFQKSLYNFQAYPLPKPSFPQFYRDIYQAKQHSHLSEKVQTPANSVFSVAHVLVLSSLDLQR